MEKSRQRNMVILAGILAVTLSITAVFAIQTASAQAGNQTATDIPDLKGSVSINNATNEFVQENLKVPFSTAAQTALGQVDGGTVISGRLAAVQGYLAYVFKVANYDEGTFRLVIVDAGNGQMLYTSDAQTLQNGGLGGCDHGHHGGFDNGQWKGRWAPSESTQSSLPDITTSA